MTKPDPLLAPPSIPEKEEEAMMDMLAGLSVEDTARKHSLLLSRLRSLKESDNYAQMKEVKAKDVKDRAQALLVECTVSAATALSPQAFADDPKLALQFLKETGSLRQAQKELGQEVEEEDRTIRIEFNDFGLTPQTPSTIDVPSTRLIDTEEPSVSSDEE